MSSIFISPEALSPRSLDVAALGETRVGAFPAVGVIVAKGVKAGVKAGTKPAVQTGFGVTVAISIVMG